MTIRLLKAGDRNKLEEYLAPHQAECMFICSNLKAGGIIYKSEDFQGEYFGYFGSTHDDKEKILGVIVHYWNDNVIMHASHLTILEQLVWHLQENIRRPIIGILGPNAQAEYVIKRLGLSNARFSINSKEELYEMNLTDLNKLCITDHCTVVPARDVPKSVLIQWMKSYDIEALGLPDDDDLERQVEEYWNSQLQRNNSWVLLSHGIPVSLSAFNARLTDMVQVGPVWTPPLYRNKGFARLLLAYTLHQEKNRGVKKAILFTKNPAAIKAYRSIGFKKIGDYHLALLENPIRL